MISGKEAKLAWANGKEVEFYSEILGGWVGLNEEPFLSNVFEYKNMRLKPQTITINGVEVPKPFKAEDGYRVWIISDYKNGYHEVEYNSKVYNALGCWRTEEEIKQVVEALRSVFTT